MPKGGKKIITTCLSLPAWKRAANNPGTRSGSCPIPGVLGMLLKRNIHVSSTSHSRFPVFPFPQIFLGLDVHLLPFFLWGFFSQFSLNFLVFISHFSCTTSVPGSRTSWLFPAKRQRKKSSFPALLSGKKTPKICP